MKTISTLLSALFITIISFAQEDVKLNDSVIFINNKPVALYEKQINKASHHYGMEVYSFTDYVLIKAELLMFKAPVDELKSFYYYELTFPPTNDTLAVYIDGELSFKIADLIKDYHLIINDQLNKTGVNRLKKTYPGATALVDKIKEIENHLNTTRFFDQQVVRDRTKPVKISKDDKKIMQDGVIIGSYMHTALDRQVNNATFQPQFMESQSSYNKAIADGCIIYFQNNNKASSTGNGYPDHLGKRERGYELYKLSLTKDIVLGSMEDYMLIRICCLIEDYRL